MKPDTTVGSQQREGSMKKIKNLLAAVLITSILFSSNAISYAADTAEGNRNEIGQETSVQAEAAVETEAETAKKA